MASVSTMHEQVHQRASKEGQPKEDAKDMGAVFGKQHRAGYDDKSEQNESCA
jgi:hypothetical protein